MRLGTVLVILAVLLLVGSWPAWPYSRGWGYMPTSLVAVILLLLVLLVALGRL